MQNPNQPIKLLSTSNLCIHQPSVADMQILKEWLTGYKHFMLEDILALFPEQETLPDNLFILSLAKDSTVIGLVALRALQIAQQSAIIITYVGHPHWEGKGYGEEATHAFLEYAFHTLGTKSATYSIVDGDYYSNRHSELLTLSRSHNVDTTRQSFYTYGRVVEKLTFNITARNWEIMEEFKQVDARRKSIGGCPW